MITLAKLSLSYGYMNYDFFIFRVNNRTSIILVIMAIVSSPSSPSSSSSSSSCWSSSSSWSWHLSSFLTTLPSRSSRTTLRALNRDPIPCKMSNYSTIRILIMFIIMMKKKLNRDPIPYKITIMIIIHDYDEEIWTEIWYPLRLQLWSWSWNTRKKMIMMVTTGHCHSDESIVTIYLYIVNNVKKKNIFEVAWDDDDDHGGDDDNDNDDCNDDDGDNGDESSHHHRGRRRWRHHRGGRRADRWGTRTWNIKQSH